MCVLSCVCLFAAPWTIIAHQALSMGFSKKEYWNELPFPSPGNLPDPWIKPASLASPALAGCFCRTKKTNMDVSFLLTVTVQVPRRSHISTT